MTLMASDLAEYIPDLTRSAKIFAASRPHESENRDQSAQPAPTVLQYHCDDKPVLMVLPLVDYRRRCRRGDDSETSTSRASAPPNASPPCSKEQGSARGVPQRTHAGALNARSARRYAALGAMPRVLARAPATALRRIDAERRMDHVCAEAGAEPLNPVGRAHVRVCMCACACVRVRVCACVRVPV